MSVISLVRLVAAASAICVGLVALPERSAAQLPIDTTSVTISIGHDTQVDRLTPASPRGSQSTIMVDAFFKPELSRIAIRFDQNSILNAIGTKNLVRARLVLTPSRYADSTGSPPYINAYRLTANWQQSTTTWNSLFPFGTEPFNNASPTVKVAVPNQSTAKVTFDVTKDVAAFNNGTPNYGWLLKDDGYFSGVSQPYHSFEAAISANRPQLIIETVDPSTEATAPSITFPAAGTAIIRAPNGTAIVDVPLKGRTFATLAAMLQWCATNLNISIERNTSGTPIAGDGHITTIGDFYYIDPAGNSVRIDDVAAAMIGGQDGYVTIGSTKTCIRAEGCGQAPFAAPANANECDPPGSGPANSSFAAYLDSLLSGATCAAAGSFKNSFVIYNSIGTSISTSGLKTTQNPNVFKHSCSFCWKRKIFPWRCCKDSGESSLEVANLYQLEDMSGTFGWPNSKTATNVSRLRQQEWAVGRIGVKIKNNGQIRPQNPNLGLIYDFKGVCGETFAQNGNRSFSFFTGAGNADLVCGPQ
jgi:hypothetical protein